jgi:hypothetical protein
VGRLRRMEPSFANVASAGAPPVVQRITTSLPA